MDEWALVRFDTIIEMLLLLSRCSFRPIRPLRMIPCDLALYARAVLRLWTKVPTIARASPANTVPLAGSPARLLPTCQQHSSLAGHLCNKTHKASDKCLWCGKDEASDWSVEAPRVTLIFEDEKATRGILTFLRETKGRPDTHASTSGRRG